MYTIDYTKAAKKTLEKWKKSNPQLFKKATQVLMDIMQHPRTRHILDENEPNMAYDVIKENIYTENMKQVGIKIIPNT